MRRAIPFLLVLAACRGLPSEPDNPHVIECTWGIATGTVPEEAQQVAAAVATARPLLARMHGFVDQPLRVHVFPGSLPHGWCAMIVEEGRGDRWIAVEAGHENLPFFVAHEMAHFYFGELLDRFPQIVEEGVCEMIASRVYSAPQEKMWKLIGASLSYLDDFEVRVEGPASKANLGDLLQVSIPIEVALEMDNADLKRLEDREKLVLYGIGWTIAEALGLGGVAELDVRRENDGLEQVPVDWILKQADLMPLTQEKLHAAFARMSGLDSGEAHGQISIELSDG